MNFKCVVAIKTKTQCKCTIRIDENTKVLDLPSQEAQFFDFSSVPDHVFLDFQNFGVLSVPIVQEITDEMEITDSFQIKDLKGKYYILFLLAKNIKFEENQTHQSPLRHYLTSYKSRTKERQQKAKTQQLIKNIPNSAKQDNQNELLKQQFETVKEENKLLKMKEKNDYFNELDISQAKRKQLQQFISQFSEELTQQNETLLEKAKYQGDLIIEFQTKIDELQDNNNQQLLKIEHLQDVIQDKQSQITSLQLKIADYEEQKQMCQLLAKQKKDLEQILQQITSQYEKELLEKRQQIQKLKNEDLLNATASLQKETQERVALQEKAGKLQEQIEGLKNFINQLETKLSLTEQRNQKNLILEQLKDQLENENNKKEQIIKKMQDDINLLQKQISYQQFHSSDELDKQIQQLNEQQVKNQGQISQLQTENQKLKSEILKIPLLSQNLQSTKIQYSVPDFPDLSVINSKVEKYQKQINQQLKELNTLRETVHELSKKHDEKELHNSQLKSIMTQIVESNQAYIPVKGDDLDQQLANFFNSRLDKDKYIPQIKRQSEGIYLYGHKRIFIKQEQGKILIRSGGGYLTIEEFLGLNESKIKDVTTDVIKRQAVQKKTERMKTIT